MNEGGQEKQGRSREKAQSLPTRGRAGLGSVSGCRGGGGGASARWQARGHLSTGARSHRSPTAAEEPGPGQACASCASMPFIGTGFSP